MKLITLIILLFAYGSSQAQTPMRALAAKKANQNFIVNSQDFSSQTYWPHDGTILINDITAPDATMTGNKYTTAGAHDLIYQVIPVSASTAYTYSYYVKAGTITGLYLYVTDQSDATLASVEISSLINPSTWTRVSGSFTTGGGTTSVKAYLKPYDGDNAGTVWLWGAQLNRGSSATTYVKTP